MSITRIDKPKDVGIDLEIEIPHSVPSSFRRIRKIEIFPVNILILVFCFYFCLNNLWLNMISIKNKAKKV